MILSLLKTYSRLFIFTGGLLLGIQVPNFVDQYERRIDAHYLEVSANISGFQSTADQLFSGDMEALITYYAASNDLVFESDAQSIRRIVDRYNRISSEREALSGNIFATAMHVILYADDEFMDETFDQYGYTVPLNMLVVEWGPSYRVAPNNRHRPWAIRLCKVCKTDHSQEEKPIEKPLAIKLSVLS